MRPHFRLVVFGMFLGLMVLLSGGILSRYISFRAVSELARITPVTQFKVRISQEPFPNYYLLLGLIGVVTSLIAGGVTGFVIGTKGDLYGAGLGVSEIVISVVLRLLIFLFVILMPTSLIYGPRYPAGLARARSTQQLFDSVRSIPKNVPSLALLMVETSVGGYLGCKLKQRDKNRRS